MEEVNHEYASRKQDERVRRVELESKRCRFDDSGGAGGWVLVV
jgi:hypothetical protein